MLKLLRRTTASLVSETFPLEATLEWARSSGREKRGKPS